MNEKQPVKPVMNEIDSLIRARYPILYLLTHEEARLENLLSSLAQKQSKEFHHWTATTGLKLFSAEGEGKYNDPLEVLMQIQKHETPGIFLLKDFHPFLEDPHVVRRLRDIAHDLKGSYKTILIASPRLNLPIELEKEVTLVDIPLPDAQELGELLQSIVDVVSKRSKSSVNLKPEEARALVRAAQGLTLTEAENAFAKSVVNDSVLDVRDVNVVLKEKEQIIRKSGILEFFPANAKISEVGGLQNLKYWLGLRSKAFSSKASDFGLPTPKGVLLLGAPGCGKSLTAKAVANSWRLPLLRLDFGKIFSGLVGSSEENMRRALKVAEGVSPCVLWIDEIEKGLAGGVSGSSDGGTGARVFGTFLTWMQEKESTVFVVATANKIEALPPELLRRGRFDEIFFMDLPHAQSRADILTIHLAKRKRDPKTFDMKNLVQLTEGFSGAELEHVIVEGLFTAYHEQRELKNEDVQKAIKETIPLSTTYREELERTRQWAKTRARNADAIPAAVPATPGSRASKLETVD